MKPTPRLPFDVQHLVVRESAGDLLSFDRKRISSLASLALVSKAFQEIVYPLLYSSISLRPLPIAERELITKAPSSARPAHPDQEDLFDFLRSSPSLAAQVVSLQVLTWNTIDFDLFRNLRHFDCAWEVCSEVPVLLDVKPKLWSMKIRIGVEEVGFDADENEYFDLEHDLDNFEDCVDTSELKSLTLLYQPEEEPFSTLYLFPSLQLPSLTSLTIQQDSGNLNSHFFPPSNLKPLLQRVGSQLLHLSLHEDSHEVQVHSDLAHEPWIFPLCPNLLAFDFSGPYYPQFLIDNGHPSLRTLSIGLPYLRTKIEHGRRRDADTVTLEDLSDVETEYEAHTHKFLDAAEKEAKLKKKEKRRWTSPDLLATRKPNQALLSRFPVMETLRLRGISFQKEDMTEDKAWFVAHVQDEFGWDVKDKFETSWSEKFDPDYRSPSPELSPSEEEEDEYDDEEEWGDERYERRGRVERYW